MKRRNEGSDDTRRRSARRLRQSSTTASLQTGTSRSRPTSAAVAVAVAASNKNSSPSPSDMLRDGEKPSALSDATNQRRRKRTPSSDNAPSKLPQTSLDSHRRSPRQLGSKQDVRHDATNVTPSPALKTVLQENVDSSNRSLSSALSTASSRTRSVATQEQRPRLPDGVVNLYPSSVDNNCCDCRLNHCSPDATTEAYLASYGLEYSRMLKEKEALLSSYDDTLSTLDDDDYTCVSSTARANNATDTVVEACIPTSLNRSYSGSSASTLSSTNDYAADMNYMPRQPHLTRKMRSILMDWLTELAEEYKLQPRTLFLAARLVDKSLAMAKSCHGSEASVESDSTDDHGFIVKRESLQCLGCSCMWIACKLEELEPPSVDDFVYISDSSYTRQQISEMELVVCTALRFRLWHVTPCCFVHEFLRASQACSVHGSLSRYEENVVLKNMVLFLLELSLLSYKLVMVKPSLLAAAAVYLARITLGIGGWTKTLQHYTGYSVFDLQDTVETIHKMQYEAEESELKSVYSKYKTEKYNSVSLKTVRHEDDLGF